MSAASSENPIRPPKKPIANTNTRMRVRHGGHAGGTLKPPAVEGAPAVHKLHKLHNGIAEKRGATL